MYSLSLAFFLLFSLQLLGSSSSSKKKDGCSKPTLKNGKIKVKNIFKFLGFFLRINNNSIIYYYISKPRSNGRVVKYSCNRDYILVGESTSTCLQGEWTSETPVCVGTYAPGLMRPTKSFSFFFFFLKTAHHKCRRI